jgi:hypothetical protein
MSFSGFKTGTYIPTANKCLKTKFVKYRSSYELEFAKILDGAASIQRWEYEKWYIAYKFLGKTHHYLVDFYIELNNGQKFLIEIKPSTFYNRAMQVHDKNWAKWESAISYAKNITYRCKLKLHLRHTK